MTAQEMFEELGYHLHLNDEFHLTYGIKHDENGSDNDPLNWDYIDFYLKDKTIDIDYMLNVEIKLHKAIHQQLIELGWIE